ncbi:MAG: acetoacetate--CoA ligase [Alphaproteobacteria bacterium]|nr:acetoacetate--CoA ligase [Alphaproteobacteria bacterium]
MKTDAPKMLWDPAEHAPEVTRLAEFARFLQQRTGQGFGKYDAAGYRALQKWSVENPESFYSAAWDFCGITGEKGKTVIEKTDKVPWARFFPDSKISYAENMLAFVQKKPAAPAIIARVQDGPDRVISWQELYNQVSLWEQALLGAGVAQGDRVAVYLPNIPETVIVLLAVSQIGAVFSSAGMEMGAADLINRFTQVKPKILITAEGYAHGAKIIDRKDVVERAKQEIDSLEKIIMVSEVKNFLAPYKPKKIDFVRRDFNQPLYILFSSGSTGKPKCFEHSSGGILLKHLLEYQLNSDVREGDRVFYHATPSWMMWNWLAGGLASGATILMYDGSPAYPDVYAQWNFTSAHHCTHHGTAAPVILSWLNAKAEPGSHCDLSDLRVVLSTGAVLPKQGFEYIHAAVKEDVKIASISGGTDIVGCFVGGNPFTPTYAGQVNGPMLGMDVEVWDESGKPVSEGQAGELVCKAPFPSMPLRFIDDGDGARYRAEYFENYPGQVWRHGDSVEKTKEGQFVIIGRSDATLNQNGVRIGPVAIYDQLKPFMDKIREAAAVDFTRPDNKQTITILFLALNDSIKDGAAAEVPGDLAAAIKKAVKDNVTPYAIPTEIIAVPGVLKTPNGKTAEVVIKKILSGKPVPNASLYGEELVRNFEKIGAVLTTKYR